MNSLFDGENLFDGELTELETGVFYEQLESSNVPETLPNEDFDGTEMVFGVTETAEVFPCQLGVVDEMISYSCFIGSCMSHFEVSREEVLRSLEENGLFSEFSGMSLDDVGQCVEFYIPYGENGAYVECRELSGFDELCVFVDSGDFVLCYVNSAALEYEPLADIPGMNADHFVQVIGVDLSDIEKEKVVYRDSFQGSGFCKSASVGGFLKAWGTNNYYAITIAPKKNNED